MTRKWIAALLLSFTMFPFCVLLNGQQPKKPASGAKPAPRAMTNLDVIKMVQTGLSESTIIATIQTRKSKFDVSPDGLIGLHKGGVTQAEMDAIMAVANGSTPTPAPGSAAYAATPPTTSTPAPTPTPAPTKSRLPVVSVVQNGVPQDLALEKTQLAQTKTKPSSMKSLASDSVLTQALTAEMNSATAMAATHMGSSLGGSSMQQAGSIMSGLMAHRKPAVTYVWGVPNPASTNILSTSTPSFNVSFANTPGVNPDDFEPAIVKLTPAQNTCRIIGATQGKEDLSSSSAADWQLYSSFLEERVAVNSQKLGKGQYQLSVGSSLMPGEYAIVLRPTSKSKKFSGGDVARGQGDGLMFDSAWSFQVSNDAQ